MLKVIINDDYYLEIDSYNHTLYKQKVSQRTGKPTVKVIGYYRDLSSSLLAAMNDSMTSYDNKNLSLRDYLDQINNDMSKFSEDIKDIDSKVKSLIGSEKR